MSGWWVSKSRAFLVHAEANNAKGAIYWTVGVYLFFVHSVYNAFLKTALFLRGWR